tara:strand:- start:1390 stop:1656 length:267 start_codon:yes stop_codon:yes gene_type:complete
MEEPKRIPLDPTTPRIASVKKIPMPALETQEKQYPEPMTDDIYINSSKQDKKYNAEEAFSNFIQKAKESKERYDLWVQKQKKTPKDST